MRRLSLCLRRQWLSLMLAVVLAGLLVNGFWGSSGAQDLLILRHHSGVLMVKRDKLILDNAAFRKRIAQLKSDDTYLQRLIRLELGYVRPGEIVYRFPKSEQP
jgi:cell division protein FtsB